MKYLKWALVGLGPMLLFALWLKSANDAERERLMGFCQSTHGGEPWEQTLGRARARGYEFKRNSPTSAFREEYLATVERFGAGMACRITVEQGHVVRTSTGDLGVLK